MKHKEFGSDFHFPVNLPSLTGAAGEKWRDGNMYATGRQAINAIIAHKGWKRIWIPAYFCYDIVESIARTGIDIEFYGDHPATDDAQIISGIRFRKDDVLLRMNYFGLRGWRDSEDLGVEVIEDHSHSLTGGWVNKSNADWCIASLRKTLPITEGGVLWSPKEHKLPDEPQQTSENLDLSSLRRKAMELKGQYIEGVVADKELFRKLLMQTENALDDLPFSTISQQDMVSISSYNVVEWDKQKKRNWTLLNNALKEEMGILQPEDDDCIPFSLIVKGQKYRQALIENNVYPAILWQVPPKYNMDLMSLHCDGRYSENDIEVLINILRSCLK